MPSLTGGDISAIHFEPVGSVPEYKNDRYRAVGKADELISCRPPGESYRLYDDYRVHRH